MRSLARATALVALAILAFSGRAPMGAQGGALPPLVFVSRAIPPEGTIYWNVPRSLPGVAAYSRFQVASPGRLLVREPDGQIRVLVDGGQPASTPFRLVDVNAPAVSWDGQQIAFAGLREGNYPIGPMQNPGAWRLYVINLDGSGLRPLTLSDRDGLDLSQFQGLQEQFRAYDDTDPAWLPDGRIVFSSTRFPGFGQYGAARASQLYVIEANGSGLHRITGEKNGADRPLVDPLTGRIVYSRWWRNFRFASNDLSTVAAPGGGYRRHMGLLSAADDQMGGVPGGRTNLVRNSWPLGTINPDGTDLRQFAGASGLFFEGEDDNHAYGGAFAPDGSFYANFFPMKNGTEASGFGGIRHYQRGIGKPRSVIGITTNAGQTLASLNPPSYGVYRGVYAAEPEVLPDGRLVVSIATSVGQDYGLYLVNADGSGVTPLYDEPGRTELRARLAVPRPIPPVIPDAVSTVASPLPPRAQPPYDGDGTFIFDALNVYFNAPVDVPIVSAPPIGSAEFIAFFMDHQRLNPGSLERLDWPILLGTAKVAPDGSIAPTALPATLPLFEQLRGAGLVVPQTGRGFGGDATGAAHVAGMNYGRPGTRATCVGCHAGHTLIEVPPSPEAARWTNLAPGARIISSSMDPALGSADGLVDRKAHTGPSYLFWRSHPAQSPNGQWVGLVFPQRIRVRTVRLYDTRSEAELTTQVESARVRLFADDRGAVEVASITTGPISENGTDVTFPDVPARIVGVEFLNVSGTTRYMRVASLGEVEVIARADEGAAACSAPGSVLLDGSVTRGQVTLSWQPPGGEPATRYTLEAGSRPGQANLARLSLGGQTTTFATAAPPGRYYLRVVASGACGAGQPSNELLLDVGACPAPGRPAGLTHAVNGRTVTFNWQAPDGGSPGYVIEAGSRPGMSDLYVGPVATPGLVVAAPPGTYYVRTRSRSACGSNSWASNEVAVTVR